MPDVIVKLHSCLSCVSEAVHIWKTHILGAKFQRWTKNIVSALLVPTGFKIWKLDCKLFRHSYLLQQIQKNY